MAKNPQTENGHIQIANEIWNEIIRRDFSKRQLAILQLILRLSYGCRKKSATIPKLKDFEVCGVGKTNITLELKYLTNTKVIVWDKEENNFTFNKDYDMWQISPVKGWDEEIFNGLLHLNLSKKLSKQEPPKSQSYQNDNHKVIKTITTKLSKQELQKSFLAVVSRAKVGSKYIIKDIIKNRNKKEIEERKPNPFDFYEQNGFGCMSPFIREQMIAWLEQNEFDEPEEIMIQALTNAIENNVLRWNYVNRTLVEWSNKKLRTLSQVKADMEQFKARKQASKSYPNYKQHQPPKRSMPSWIVQQQEAENHEKQASNSDNSRDSEEWSKRIQERLHRLKEAANQ